MEFPGYLPMRLVGGFALAKPTAVLKLLVACLLVPPALFAGEDARALKISAKYSYLSVKNEAPAGGLASFASFRDPRHQVQTHGARDVARRVTLDGFVFGISPIADRRIPGYVRAGARLAWKLREHLEVSAGGWNLPDGRHREFLPEDFVIAQEVRRSVYARFAWRS